MPGIKLFLGRYIADMDLCNRFKAFPAILSGRVPKPVVLVDLGANRVRIGVLVRIARRQQEAKLSLG